MARALPDLIARIRLDSTGVQEGVGLLQGELNKSNLAIGTAAAVVGGVVGVLFEASKKYEELATSVHDYMRVTGESADTAGRQVQAFTELGVSGESAQAAMLKFSKAIETTPKKLEALGIETVRNSKGNVDLNESLYHLIDAYNGTEDAAKRNAIVLVAFGKGGAAMIPILAEGSDALRKLEADARVTFTEKDIEQAHKYKLEQMQVKASTDAVWDSLGQKLLPALKGATEEYLRSEYVAKQLREAHVSLGDGMTPLSVKTQHLIDKFRKQFDASQAAKEKLDGYTDAAGRAAESAAKLAGAIDDATRAEESATNEGIRLERANLHVAESNGKVELAQEALTKAVKLYGPSSDEALKAAQDLTNVTLDQKQSYLDAAGAAQSLAEYQAGPGLSKTDLATVGHQAYLKKLQEEAATLAPGSALRVYLEQYIARLGAIPTDVNTNISTTFGSGSGGGAGRRGALESGGPALPNSIYTVGEQGPETLVMGPQGGTVIPNSGGTNKLTLPEARDMVALLGIIARNTSVAPSFSTTAYGRS